MSIASTLSGTNRNNSIPALYAESSLLDKVRKNSLHAATLKHTSPSSRVRSSMVDSSDCNNDLVTINVSGRRYQTYLSTLERFPTSLLGNPMKRQHFYRHKTGEFFFDRHRKAFGGILYYYQSNGVVQCPPGVLENIFAQEILFFELESSIEESYPDELDSFEVPKNPLLSKIWILFEKPNSSLSARIVAVLSIIIIMLSITIFCLETLPEMNPDKNKNMKDIWHLLNTICNIWFTIEYGLRLIAAPKKLTFLRSAVNLIDLISILPFYLSMVIRGSEGGSIEVLRVVRVIRVIRIFKLTRHSRGLHVLANTIKASFQELLMLVLFLAIAIILFASAVYFAEHHYDGDRGFKSIPHSFWWAVITMTTVGYGDLAPKTLIGQLVGTLCAISGVLVIALPVPVIVSNFEFYYKQEQTRQARETEIAKKEKEQASFKDMRKSIQMMTSTSIILAGGIKDQVNTTNNNNNIDNNNTDDKKTRKGRIQDRFSFSLHKTPFGNIDESYQEMPMNGTSPMLPMSSTEEIELPISSSPPPMANVSVHITSPTLNKDKTSNNINIHSGNNGTDDNKLYDSINDEVKLLATTNFSQVDALIRTSQI